jgi:phosphohistidine phosphatase
MVKRKLTLIRHGKSCWQQAHLSDKQRPLAQRGVNDVPTIARHNSYLLSTIEHFYCSTAIRAMQTLELLLANSTLEHKPCSYLDELYCFDCQQLLSQLSLIPEKFSHIALVGHNPALTELINFLAQDELANLATGSLTTLELTTGSWQDISTSSAKIRLLASPKAY